MNEREKSVGFLFSDIARFRGVIYDQMMEQYNLTLAQVYVLNNLYREDGLTQKAIAERMTIGTVTISGLVDRLEAKGLVTRETDSRDRRAKKVWLTDKSREVRSALTECLTDLNDTAFDGFTKEEVEIFASFLRRTKANLKARLGKE